MYCRPSSVKSTILQFYKGREKEKEREREGEREGGRERERKREGSGVE